MVTLDFLYFLMVLQNLSTSFVPFFFKKKTKKQKEKVRFIDTDDTDGKSWF